MNIEEATELLRLRLKDLEQDQWDENLPFLDRLSIKAEILEIQEQLGDFQRQVQCSDNCESCSG